MQLNCIEVRRVDVECGRPMDFPYLVGIWVLELQLVELEEGMPHMLGYEEGSTTGKYCLVLVLFPQNTAHILKKNPLSPEVQTSTIRRFRLTI